MGFFAPGLRQPSARLGARRRRKRKRVYLPTFPSLVTNTSMTVPVRNARCSLRKRTARRPARADARRNGQPRPRQRMLTRDPRGARTTNLVITVEKRRALPEIPIRGKGLSRLGEGVGAGDGVGVGVGGWG